MALEGLPTHSVDATWEHPSAVSPIAQTGVRRYWEAADSGMHACVAKADH